MIHINNTPITNYKNLEIVEEVNGSLTLSFTSFNYANKAHNLLKEESIVTVNDYDFKIKQLSESTYSKHIQAVSTFFDLGGHYIDDMFAGTRYLDDLLSFTFNGTGWTYSLKTSNKLLTITNYGNDNALKLLLDLCAVAKIEYQIMPNNHVEFDTQIGPDNDAQYRYGHNIKTLSKNVDTTNLRTRIRGYGADGLNVIYTSPNASKFGIIEADPIHDDRFHIEENLANYVKEQLQDEPEIAIELDTVELINRELGERIWLIYEPLDIEIKSRILSKRSIIRNDELVTESVVIGNSLPKSTSDLFAEQKLEYDTQNKINRSRFEQTNDRITMEVEELEHGIEENRSLFEITAKDIRSEVSQVDKRLGDRITTTNSRITQTASEITSTVESNYRDLDGRVSSNRSEIQQLDREISLKVNSNELSSEIKLEIGKATIEAEQINFKGAVFGESATFKGTVSARDFVGPEGQPHRISFGSKEEYGFINGADDAIRLAFNSQNYLQITKGGIANFYVHGERKAYFDANGLVVRGNVYADNIGTTSARDKKKNIEKYTGLALGKVLNTEVYQYHFKGQTDTSKKKLGLIFDEAPFEIMNDDRESIDLYAMISLLWRAIQEQHIIMDGIKRGIK